jgi:hypothetical protein
MENSTVITKANCADAATIIAAEYPNPVIAMEHLRETITSWIMEGDYTQPVTLAGLRDEVATEFGQYA